MTNYKPRPNYVSTAKTFFLRRADMRGPVEMAVAPLLLFATAREVGKHPACAPETAELMKHCTRLLAAEIVAPLFDLQEKLGNQRSGATTHNAARAVIDGLPLYLWGLDKIKGGKPYEAMLAEAVHLLNHLLDLGFIIADEDSPAMQAASLLTDHINDLAEADKTDRVKKIVDASLRRLPAYLAKLQQLGLFLALKEQAA